MCGVVLVLGVLHGGYVRFRLRVGAGFRFGEFSCRLGFLLRGALRDGGGDNGGAALAGDLRGACRGGGSFLRGAAGGLRGGFFGGALS